MADNNSMGQLRGLSSQEVLESRAKWGENVLTPPAREPWWRLFLEKFEDPVIRILLIAVGIAFLVGLVHHEYTETIGILVAILLATTMAFLNEYRAGREFDLLNRVSDDVEFRVIRDGGYQAILKKELVVGDVLLLETGEEIPADARVLQSISLQVDESKITGESDSVPKFSSTFPSTESGEAPRSERQTAYPVDHVYRGTMVRDGHGVVEIFAVGDHTEIGKTAREAAEETSEETPLNRQLKGLSQLIGVIGFGVAGGLFVALSGHAAAVGEIVMDSRQWTFSLILIASVLIALTRVWLPIVYDFFDVVKKPKERPAWLEEEGFRPWLRQLGYGLAFFVVAVGCGWFAGFLPDSPSGWIDFAAGRKFLQFFMIAITIIVVAVPEGLAMSVTLSLAYSMRKMTATNNLVRRMHACETIGAATVICTDKTGTLTKNEMSVFETAFPVLKATPTSDSDKETPDSRLIREAMSANTTANLSRGDGGVTGLGNPTECALLLWLDADGVDYQSLRNAFEVTEQVAFSTERKYMATRGKSPQSGDFLHVKGAPEVVLAKCGTIFTPQGSEPLTTAAREEISEQIRSFQARGMRVLGFAGRSSAGLPTGSLEEYVADLSWLGFTAISDPIRSDVPDAVAACAKAGIGVKIVTGDNRETATEIGRQIGLLTDSDDIGTAHLTGSEFEALSDEELKRRVAGLKILSRAKPSHKLRLVKTLQELNEVVAVTGDGTNDAPALNYANVGLAMGKNGTAVAKEASDIILLDDSFRSIVNAIMWGRSLYQNIQRFVLFQLTVNVAALVIALLGPFIGVELPLTVTQMLWVNLIMDTFAALALATEPPHWDVMDRKPRSPEAFIVTPEMARKILEYGAAFIVVLLLVLLTIQKDGISTYELSVFFSIFVMLQFWNLFNARCFGLTSSAFHGLLENRSFVGIALLILIGQILMVQFGGEVFRTTPISFRDWVLLLVSTSFVLWAGEYLRLRQRKKA
jgi:Ca2+-transporting ATPase